MRFLFYTLISVGFFNISLSCADADIGAADADIGPPVMLPGGEDSIVGMDRSGDISTHAGLMCYMAKVIDAKFQGHLEEWKANKFALDSVHLIKLKKFLKLLNPDAQLKEDRIGFFTTIIDKIKDSFNFDRMCDGFCGQITDAYYVPYLSGKYCQLSEFAQYDTEREIILDVAYLKKIYLNSKVNLRFASIALHDNNVIFGIQGTQDTRDIWRYSKASKIVKEGLAMIGLGNKPAISAPAGLQNIFGREECYYPVTIYAACSAFFKFRLPQDMTDELVARPVEDHIDIGLRSILPLLQPRADLKYFICGHSLGGGIAHCIAVAVGSTLHPEIVARLDTDEDEASARADFWRNLYIITFGCPKMIVPGGFFTEEMPKNLMYFRFANVKATAEQFTPRGIWYISDYKVGDCRIWCLCFGGYKHLRCSFKYLSTYGMVS